jgi:hypothetical protein
LPSGYLDHQITLTVVGSRNVLEKLEPADLEIVIDADGKGDQWIAHADKKTLISKNPSVDLRRNIKQVLQNDFIVSLTPLVTDQIPVIVTKPVGSPPPGYQFLDVWPQYLTQTVTGPEKEVQKLKMKGVKITFDLSRISEQDLDKLAAGDAENQEEVSFYVPETWKKIAIPFLNNEVVALNDADSPSLRINFLKKTFLSLDTFIPVSLYFPLETLRTLNPDKIQLAPTPLIRKENGLYLLAEPLYAKDVSSLFLEVVRDHLQLVIIASDKDFLDWGIDFVDLKGLEKTYIAFVLAEHPDKLAKELPPHLKEDYLRSRFRTYVDQFQLFTSQKQPLSLHPLLKETHILLQ